MIEISELIYRLGAPTIVAAALVYIVLYGEVQFRYPRTPRPNTLTTPPPDDPTITSRAGK